jgi:hypothetical protein
MRLPLQLLSIASLAAACLLGSPDASAQFRAIAPDLVNPAQAVSERKLDAVAAAMRSIAALRSAYRQQLEEADPAEQRRIVTEARGALAKAVTDQGISVAEFQSVLATAQGDADLRDKILERLGVSGSSQEDDDDPEE